MAIPTATHHRHCESCDRVIPPHRGANVCLSCEGRVDGEPIGGTCPWRVVGLGELSHEAWELEMARRGTYVRGLLARRSADVKGVAA